MNPWEQLNDLRKRVSKLAATAESQAWGAIAIVMGYIGWSYWNSYGKPWVPPGQLCLVTYAIGVASYAIVTRSFRSLKRCLVAARLLFLAEIVTESEYNKMRAKCLKKADAI